MPDTEVRVAGHELDMFVAEKVMGWKLGRRYGNGNGAWIRPDEETKTYPTSWEQTPRHSTDMADAWKVVIRMTELGFWITLQSDWHGRQFNVTFRRKKANGEQSDMVDSAPLAICLAALKAVESR